KADFDAIYPELARAHDTLLAPSLLGPLTADLDQGAAVSGYMQADGIHPNADGVAVIVEALGPMVAELVALAQSGQSAPRGQEVQSGQSVQRGQTAQ
ncbi:hypothetical protein LCGC14_2479580, partial [marine sediment metagenome]